MKWEYKGQTFQITQLEIGGEGVLVVDSNLRYAFGVDSDGVVRWFRDLGNLNQVFSPVVVHAFDAAREQIAETFKGCFPEEWEEEKADDHEATT